MKLVVVSGGKTLLDKKADSINFKHPSSDEFHIDLDGLSEPNTSLAAELINKVVKISFLDDDERYIVAQEIMDIAGDYFSDQYRQGLYLLGKYLKMSKPGLLEGRDRGEHQYQVLELLGKMQSAHYKYHHHVLMAEWSALFIDKDVYTSTTHRDALFAHRYKEGYLAASVYCPHGDKTQEFTVEYGPKGEKSIVLLHVSSDGTVTFKDGPWVDTFLKWAHGLLVDWYAALDRKKIKDQEAVAAANADVDI
jgi:hypothetical protein